jgi:hypothetical protein
MVASPETIERTVASYRRATEANRGTRARRGNVVVVHRDIADEVMVTADLHGNRLNFERLEREADLEHHPRRQLVMQEVCHGGPPYPSTMACMSHLLLEDVARLKIRYADRFHFILGNHELAELTDFPITKSSRMLNLTFRCGLQEMYGQAADGVREAAMEFIQSCPLAVRLDNGVFVCHSAPDRVVEDGFDPSIFERPLLPVDLLPRGDVFRLVWGRDFRAENAAAFAKLVGARVLVHGHDPCPGGFRAPNDLQVILDCCGHEAGFLLLPTGRGLSHEQVVTLVRALS